MSSNTNIGNTPVNQGYVQLIHTGETGGIDGTLRTLYDGDGTASDLQIASNKVKVSTELYIGSKTATEFIQDIVGDMFTTGSYTNITTTYDDTNGNIDLNATGAVSGITGGTGIDATGSGNITIAIDSTVATLAGTQTLTNKTLTAPTLTGTTQGASITLSGDLTVNGTTTTVNQTNLDVSDNIIGLNRGASSNANDSGLIIERGSTGDNAAIIWDESADKFTLGTTTSTPSATGNLTISTGTLVANVEGNITSSSASITGGSITGITDLAIADGGTGASNAHNARINLGLGTLAELNSIQVANFLASAITTSAEAFADNDTTVMTSAAINDRIESFGYVTSSGISFNGSTANGLLTFGNSTTADVESNLTFDGSTLKVTGDTLIGRTSAFSSARVEIQNDATEQLTLNNVSTDGKMLSLYNSGSIVGGLGNDVTELVIYQGTTEAMRIDSSQNVGIGTNSPASPLHISNSTDELLKLTSTGANSEIRFSPNTSTFDVRIGATASSANSEFYVETAGTKRLYVDNSGNVGIGTESPGYKLDVSGQGKVTNGWLVDNGTTAGFFTTDSDNVNFGSSTSGKGLRLFSANDEKMRIDSSGNVGIGTASPGRPLVVNGSSDTFLSIVSGATGDGGILFGDSSVDYDGQIRYNNSSHFMFFKTNNVERMRLENDGDLHLTADVIAYSTTPSDRKLKDNIKDIEYGLDTIMQLSPKEYDWKKDNRHDIGFIAQEVEEVIPEIVKNKEWFDDKIKTLDYEKLTAVLIKAVQEQQNQINELREKLNG